MLISYFGRIQKQDVLPVSIFVAIDKKKSKYKYDWDDSLSSNRPLFIKESEVKNNPDKLRSFYKIKDVTKVFSTRTRKMLSMALVLEPVTLN